MWTAAVIGSMYCAAGLSAIWYPGTAWIDPEFGEGAPQLGLFVGLTVLPWVGYGVEVWRLGGLKGD